MIDKIVANAVAAAQNNMKFNQGDFYGSGSVTLHDNDGNISLDGNGNPITDKGLLYCGHCRQLKQTRLYNPLTKRIIQPYISCQCMMEEDEKARAKISNDNLQIRIAQNLSQADALMLKNTFAKDKSANGDAGKLCRDYCRRWFDYYKPHNIGLYIYGGVGVGKSFYAACIANEIAHVYGDTVKVVSVTRVINDLFSTDDKSSYIDSLAAVDLLVLDDFGAERKSDYGQEQVYSVVDERYKAQKPLIVTSNLDYKELSQKSNVNRQRIFDRVRDMCVPFEIKGESKRGVKL